MKQRMNEQKSREGGREGSREKEEEILRGLTRITPAKRLYTQTISFSKSVLPKKTLIP